MIPTATYTAIVGAVIAQYRDRLGEMTQAECAKRMSLAPSTWSRIEHGTSALTIVQLARFCDVIGFGRVGRQRAVKPQEILGVAERAATTMREKGVRVPIEPIKGAGFISIADIEIETFVKAAYEAEDAP